MTVEVVNAKRKVKSPKGKEVPPGERDGKAFVTFNVMIRANSREMITIIRGCMLTADGKIYPPRMRMPNGFYRNSVIFGRGLFHAIYEQVTKLEWWKQWEDIPKPTPLVEYVDMLFPMSLEDEAA